MDAVAAALGAPAVDVAATIAAVAVVCTLVVLAVGLVHAGKKAHTAAVARYERERAREGRARRTALTRGARARGVCCFVGRGVAEQAGCVRPRDRRKFRAAPVQVLYRAATSSSSAGGGAPADRRAGTARDRAGGHGRKVPLEAGPVAPRERPPVTRTVAARLCRGQLPAQGGPAAGAVGHHCVKRSSIRRAQPRCRRAPTAAAAAGLAPCFLFAIFFNFTSSMPRCFFRTHAHISLRAHPCQRCKSLSPGGVDALFLFPFFPLVCCFFSAFSLPAWSGDLLAGPNPFETLETPYSLACSSLNT